MTALRAPNAALLGLDSGTSVVKAALFDLAGREIAAAQRPTQLVSPQPGWAETDMMATWGACLEVIREVLAHPAAQGASVEAVGVSGNMIGAWMVDADGHPVRNAILWCDARTHPLLARLNAAQPGFASRIFQLDGCVIEAGCTLPLLRWFADHDPGTLQRTRWVFSSKDWIVYKLTGMAQIDPSEAAVLPGNTFTQRCDDDILEMFGIGDYARLLPPIRPSEAVIGHVLPEIAALTGLRGGTPVVAGAGDVPANALGLGAVVPGTAFTILGTNCQSCLVYDHPIFEPAEVGLLFYVPGGRWFKALMNVAGTTNLDWAIAQFCGEERAQAQSRDDLYRRVEALAANSPIGANGVMYHPYLGTAGVIAPFVEPTARAQFLGLHGGHTRADLLRAVYEGVALAIRDCYAALPTPISRILFAGGGARSPLWAQMIADCLGVEVALPVGREFGAKGAALLAGVGVGVFADVIAASHGAAEVARVFTPRSSFTSAYDAVFERYRDGRRLALPLWHRLNA